LVVCSQPPGPISKKLKACRVMSNPSRNGIWARLTVTNSGPATMPAASVHERRLLAAAVAGRPASVVAMVSSLGS
jgi:hypothetical protein